ncbi:proton channel OtopLc-like [Glandiceps talaboti]
MAATTSREADKILPCKDECNRTNYKTLSVNTEGGGEGGVDYFIKDTNEPEHTSKASTAFSQLWAISHVVVGVVLTTALVLNENISNNFEICQLDGFYFYMYSISILFIIIMRLSKMVDKERDSEGQGHGTSTYLIGGATLFGICAMLYCAFEIGAFIDHSFPTGSVIDIMETIAHFSFILAQLIFVWAYSNARIQKWQSFARVAMMSIWATNICGWSRYYVIETWVDWNGHHGELNWTEMCLEATTGNTTSRNNSNSLMESLQQDAEDEFNFLKIVRSSADFLYPAAMEYDIIMSGIMFVLYTNIAIDDEKRNTVRVKIAATKHRTLDQSYIGLASGLIVFVTSIGIVLGHISLVKREEDTTAEYVYNTFATIVYVLSSLASIVAFLKMQSTRFGWKIDISAEKEHQLETGLLLLSSAGQLVISMFTIVACSLSPKLNDTASIVVLLECTRVLQVFCQVIFLYDALHRVAPNVFQPTFTRQLIIFLMFSNITLFWLSIYDLKNAYVHLIPNCFYGTDAWSIILHLATPLEIYFRFHSAIILLELWESGG